MINDFKRFFVRGAAGKALRVTGSFFLMAALFGPLPNAPLGGPTPVAEASILDWDDVRPPLTDEADSTDADGFDLLTEFGDELHAIAVAPNGDIFVAGGEDAGESTIYRSTEGGSRWRQAPILDGGGVEVAVTVRAIAVSPNYPGDSFIVAVFSNDNGTGGEALDGIAWSTNGGISFGGAGQYIAGADWAGATEAALEDMDWLAVALSTDFDFGDDEGSIAIGGRIATASGVTTSVYRLTAALLSGATPQAGWLAFGGNGVAGEAPAEAAGDRTLHLAFSNDPDGGTLGRLWVDDSALSGTYGQLLSGAAFGGAGSGELTTADATAGQVAFDDKTDFRSGDRWWAAISVGGAAGGIFRFSSGTGWEDRVTGVDDDCTTGFSSLVVTGTSSSTRIVASQDGGVIVCRSNNNGSSWSDVDADGGDDVVDDGQIGAGSTRLALRRGDPSTVYWTTSGELGGVAKSTNGGSGWRDTGLTNNLYLPGGAAMDFLSDTEVIVRIRDGETPAKAALFYTNNFGTGAGWIRVFRSITIADVEVPGDFTTTRVLWGLRGGTGEERVLRSTDGGMTWFPTLSDAVDDEEASGLEVLSTSTAYLGLQNDGEVFRTTDGGATWTTLAKDFGRGVDEFDFVNETVFFVSAIDNDNIAKVWQTRDGGATFTQLGDTPWGTGCSVGNLSFRLARYNAEANTGYGIMMTNGDCTTDDVFRINIGTDSSWTDLDMDQTWRSMQSFNTRAGDGYALWLWTNAAGGACGGPCLRYTVWPLTGDPDDMQPDSGGDEDNLILELPTPPPGTTASGMNSRTSAEGTQFRVVPGGAAQRWLFFTITPEFRAGPDIQAPVNNSSVPANTGQNGIPLTLRWDSIGRAEGYDVLMGQNPDLSDGAIISEMLAGGMATSNRMTVTEAIEALTQGSTFYWAVRVTACDVDAGEDGDAPKECESPWSPTSSFTVSTTSTQVTTPQPNLPVNGSQLPGLSTELSWNNPPGVTQVQVQVTPLNGDGPAINLIIGSAISTYVVPASVFGTGPYVMLPGATYTWRVRTTGSTNPNITETDPAWGPWSEPRTFTSRRPDAGTIQLVTPINGQVLSDTTPTVEWKNAAVDEFYYEVQVSADPNFNTSPSTATAAVFWNLVHGGQSTPPNSWTVPDSFALTPGTYYWRVRQRLQATPAGSAEVGVAWSPTQRFVVQ